MIYSPSPARYASMQYRRCGNSGLLLPALSLGLWHNFGVNDDYEKCRSIIHTAFDLGITHFDLANNYGPPPGGAEINFGKIFKQDLQPYRDEIIISTKAGWPMWPGPYGDLGSKKYLVASLDQSLQRMGLNYVDIFYHHRPDPSTPVEETIGTLDLLIKQGKTLYAGISGYSPEETENAIAFAKQIGLRLLVHQPKYSMLVRTVEKGLLNKIEKHGLGCVVFSALAQGLLTDKYLKGIPPDSRAASERGNGAIDSAAVSGEILAQVKALNLIAQRRNQSLAQMAIGWVLKDPRITSVIIGASKPEQVMDSVQCLKNLSFDKDELSEIEEVLSITS